MRYLIEVELEGAALEEEGPEELARILEYEAERIREAGLPTLDGADEEPHVHPLRDVNGNTVGRSILVEPMLPSHGQAAEDARRAAGSVAGINRLRVVQDLAQMGKLGDAHLSAVGAAALVAAYYSEEGLDRQAAMEATQRAAQELAAEDERGEERGEEKDREGLRRWIRANRAAIDDHIRAEVPGARIDDDERERWVLNDEALYRWAQDEGVQV